jgi:hypothetical protein
VREEQFMEIQADIQRDIAKYRDLLTHANCFSKRLEKIELLNLVIKLLEKLKAEYDF